MAKSRSKWVQNREKTFFQLPEGNPHILIESSIFLIFGDFSVNFQIFSRSFLSGSPLQALPPKPSKITKTGSKRVQNLENWVFMNHQEVLHIWGKIVFFGFISNLGFVLCLFGPVRSVPGRGERGGGVKRRKNRTKFSKKKVDFFFKKNGEKLGENFPCGPYGLQVCRLGRFQPFLEQH